MLNGQIYEWPSCKKWTKVGQFCLHEGQMTRITPDTNTWTNAVITTITLSGPMLEWIALKCQLIIASRQLEDYLGWNLKPIILMKTPKGT